MATKVKARPPAAKAKPRSKPKPIAASNSKPKAFAAPNSKPKPTATSNSKPKPTAAKAKLKPSASATEPEPLPEAWQVPPSTKQEFIERIRTLGHRFEAYVRFMKGIDNVRGTSIESRQRALTTFYERLMMFDRELGRIQEDLQLG